LGPPYRPRRPKGGPDGARDIEALFNGSHIVWGAVGFQNSVSDSPEDKRLTKKKFRDDVQNAVKQNSLLTHFIFFTNVDLTPDEQNELILFAKQKGLSFVEIFWRERMRILLDTPEGLGFRYQYLGINLSEAEQATFFSASGNQLEAFIHKRFSDIELQIKRLEFVQNTFFATYAAHRQRTDTPNDTLERPVFLQLIQPATNKRILDLGCGDAAIGPELLQNAVASYLGLEGSHKMSALAVQTLAHTSGRVINQTIEDWAYPIAAFDLVFSRLALHYIADFATVCSNVFHALAPGGVFVFSVEHPVITSCDRGWAAGTLRQDWVVDDYFTTGLRVTSWLGGTVQKYHRTIEDHFLLLQQAGFMIEQLCEAQPQREHFHDHQTYERRKRIPLFLLLAARKPTELKRKALP
jgi:SAM-dependent methyltransferase